MTEVTVYCLHALGGSGRSFDALTARLSRSDPAIRIVPIDLPGFGDAAQTPGYTVDRMASHILDRIRRDGAARWLVLGHSMGGKVASVVARRALSGADPVFGLAGVVMLAASPPVPEPMGEDKRSEMLAWVGDGTLDPADARTFIDQNVGASLPAAADDRALADLARMNVDAWRHWLTEGSREDLSARVDILDIPAVVLAGEDDGDLGADAQPRLHARVYPRAGFVRLAGAGHLLPQERPVEVAAAISTLAAEVGAYSPRVPDEWARLIASAEVEPRVRAALATRALADDPRRAPRALTGPQLESLRALAAVVVPQPHGGRIDLAARFDAQLAAGDGDGWRPADLPPEPAASALALDALADDIARDPAATAEALVAGALAPPGSALSAAQLQAWFEDVRVDLVRHWLAHPASLARTGNDDFATRGGDRPRGFAVLGEGRRARWEPEDLGLPLTVADERRPTGDGEDAA